ncbi:serine/threonine-protein kinase ATG1b-like isoform X4 [Tasmannia lanceolata]|uniref:serine/threonine-protein kinase ATG1b-like isoform X4 n=1 Tax=Tasmannia lanceolata TaxID=3420 RepID=UPI004063B6E1
MASMAQSTNKARVLGDYIVGRQIGSGSFSVVWHGQHRIHGTEVAVQEISMERLNKKLQESLMSEILILKKINHPNILGLLDIIERHGSVSEATAKYFMLQLAAGLKVLHENRLMHHDLKPQLLLSTNDDNSILKFGARYNAKQGKTRKQRNKSWG